jgi:hypothetical protein
MSTQTTKITVDLITPTKGAVTVHGDNGGTGLVLHDAQRGEAPGSGWHVEDEDGTVIASGKRGAANAAKALARHLGVTGPLDVEVDHEYRRTGERDSDEMRAEVRRVHAAARQTPAAEERTEEPAPAEEPAPRPGGEPSVTAVIKFLKSAGFQHSRYLEARSTPVPSGFYVREDKVVLGQKRVSVFYREGDADFFKRMNQGGYTDVTDVPADPKAEQRAREYADALSPRYAVELSGTHVYVTAREELPARPKGVPTAATVRAALKAAGVGRRANFSDAYRVVDQPDHTRVAVMDDDEHLKPITDALTAEGWTFEQFETTQHFGIKITGSAPDRAARVRKLRAARAQAEQPPATPEPEGLTEQQQAALDHMRANGGKAESGQGFTVTTLRVLERQGLCTLESWMGIESLHGGKLSESWVATLTDAGWGAHPRPQEPTYKPGDTVTHVKLGGTWTVEAVGVTVGFSSPSGVSHDETGVTARNNATGQAFTALPRVWAPAAQEVPQEPVSSPQDPKEPASDTCSVCGREDCANDVCGTEPVTAPTERPTVHYNRSGQSFRVGTRVTYRDRTGFWNHGPITSIEPGEDGRMKVTFTADAMQVAPARRPVKFVSNKPGRRSTVSNPHPWTVDLDDKDLTREKTDPEQ